MNIKKPAVQFVYGFPPSLGIHGGDLWNEEMDVYSLNYRISARTEAMMGSPSVSTLRGEICRLVNE